MNSINNYNIRSKFLKKNAQFAWEKFSDFGGYPTSSMEEWRFSNPEDWLLKNISFKTTSETSSFISYWIKNSNSVKYSESSKKDSIHNFSLIFL